MKIPEDVHLPETHNFKAFKVYEPHHITYFFPINIYGQSLIIHDFETQHLISVQTRHKQTEHRRLGYYKVRHTVSGTDLGQQLGVYHYSPSQGVGHFSPSISSSSRIGLAPRVCLLCLLPPWGEGGSIERGATHGQEFRRGRMKPENAGWGLFTFHLDMTLVRWLEACFRHS